MAKTGTTVTINVGIFQFFSLLVVLVGVTWWLFTQLSTVNEKISGVNAHLADRLNTQVSSVTTTLVDRLAAVRTDLSKEITDLRDRVLLIEAANQKALRSAAARTDELARKVAIGDLERRLALDPGIRWRYVRDAVVGTVASYDPAKNKIVIRDVDGALHTAQIAPGAETVVYGPHGESAPMPTGPGTLEEGSAVAAEYRKTASGGREVTTIARPTSGSLRLPILPPSASPSTR